MRRRRLMAGLGAAAALAALGFGSGASYAYYSSPARGSGVATVGQFSGVSVSEDATTKGLLAPKGAASITFDVENDNNFPVYVTAVGEPAGSTVTSDASGCTTTDVSYAYSGGLPAAGHMVPAGTTAVVTLPGAAMGPNASGGCQGAHFHIPITVTVRQG